MNSIPNLGTNGFVPPKSSGNFLLNLLIFCGIFYLLWRLYDFLFVEKKMLIQTKEIHKAKIEVAEKNDDQIYRS